jgi:MFS family permease
MAEEKVNKEPVVPVKGKLVSVLIGAALITLTATVPYLTLINAFLFAGIIAGGAFGVYYHIIRHQVRMNYSEAFVLGALCGIGGGIFSDLLSYLLLQFFNYRPGIESLQLLAAWGNSVAPEQGATFKELLKLATEPVQLSPIDLVVSMLVTGFIYAPFAGIGGRLTVFFLKRQARRSSQSA